MTPIPVQSETETLLTILALAAGIMLTRFLPFILFAGREKLPEAVIYLGGALPHASMTLLLVYCLREVSPLRAPHGLPELLGLAFTAGLHVWRGNVLLSIAGGTLFYMMLVQRVF